MRPLARGGENCPCRGGVGCVLIVARMFSHTRYPRGQAWRGRIARGLLLLLGGGFPLREAWSQSPAKFGPTGPDLFGMPPSDALIAPGKILLQDRRGEVTRRTETGVVLPVEPGQELRAKERVGTAAASYALILGARQAAVLADSTSVDVVRRASLGLSLRAGQLYVKSLGARTEEGLWVEWGDGKVVELTGTELHLRLDPNTGEPVMDLLSGTPRAVPPGLVVRQVKEGDLDAFKEVIQWVLYYPPVLDLEELERVLGWDSGAVGEIGESLAHYRAGDLPKAHATYPPERIPTGVAERLYRAALLLSAGRLDLMSALLSTVEAEDTEGAARARRFAQALRRTEKAVKFQLDSGAAEPELASEWLAESYYQQALSTRPAAPVRDWEAGAYGGARGALEKARLAARRAVAADPGSGFARERLADLEFSFGQTRAASEEIEQALGFTPRNAPAYALRGFLRSALNRFAEALADFERALALDSKLGTAWLGQGLIRYRQGRPEEGLTSLQMAVMHEPQRALFRSYLGKGYYEAATFSSWPWEAARQLWPGDAESASWIERGDEELAMARRLDPNDPTPDLYAALMNQQRNRVNQAVTELERSKELNDNRRLVRSGFLLDQDQAVRGANLASIYRDAGLVDWSVQEASRAVQSDYANPSAHLFLANSYDALRDPTRFNLRYETPWLHELLLANLLSPVGAGVLSQNISQQEYARLFDRNRVGFSSATEYLSDGRFRQMASQYGIVGTTGYALDAEYRHQDGVRENSELEILTWGATIKQQLTPQDSAFLQVGSQDYESGDNLQYRDPAQAHRDYRFASEQLPTLLAGYHREWSPENHTLFLGGHLEDRVRFSDFQNGDPLTRWEVRGQPASVYSEPTDFDYRTRIQFTTAGLEQLFRTGETTFQAGARYQTAAYDTSATLTNAYVGQRLGSELKQSVATDSRRFTSYLYATREFWSRVVFTAGVAYDDQRYPRDYQRLPLTEGERGASQFSPKVGLSWDVTPALRWRVAYSRSLGGVGYDQSYTLEPVQLAGFTQAYRDLVPEGPLTVPSFEGYGVGWDWKPTRRVYLTLELERLESGGEVQPTAFLAVVPGRLNYRTSEITKQWDYVEHNLRVSAAWLLDDCWSVGWQYQFSRADLERTIPQVEPNGVGGGGKRFGDQHRLGPYAVFNHSSGIFARLDWLWVNQRSESEFGGAKTTDAGEDLHQVSVTAGYRFPQRRGELALGLLNLTGADYELDPINLSPEFPRERVLMVSLKLNF